MKPTEEYWTIDSQVVTLCTASFSKIWSTQTLKLFESFWSKKYREYIQTWPVQTWNSHVCVTLSVACRDLTVGWKSETQKSEGFWGLSALSQFLLRNVSFSQFHSICFAVGVVALYGSKLCCSFRLFRPTRRPFVQVTESNDQCERTEKELVLPVKSLSNPPAPLQGRGEKD